MKEYIYNRYNGIITTYKKIRDKEYLCLETGLTIDLDHQFMLGKTSENIIDLIEVGDYVNGERVDKIAEPSLVNDYKRIIYCNESEEYYNLITSKNEDIKSIVTKEMIKKVEYKVGD